jgi:uncharacterized SAM-binding protein YcdF (DUF218 family)
MANRISLFYWVRVYSRYLWRIGLILLLGIMAISSWQVMTLSTLNPDARGEAAVVLGAAVYREQPSPVFRERINHAIDLYMQGQVEALIFTGGVGRGDFLAESEAARDYAVAAGVPREDILIETVSHNTFENLSQASIVAEALGFETLVVVSDPLHMRRAMAYAEELGLQAVSSPTPTSRYQSWAPKLSFFLREVYFLSLFRLFPNAL